MLGSVALYFVSEKFFFDLAFLVGRFGLELWGCCGWDICLYCGYLTPCVIYSVGCLVGAIVLVVPCVSLLV